MYTQEKEQFSNGQLFSNMPSYDFGRTTNTYLTKEWADAHGNEVKAICSKHGFNCEFLNHYSNNVFVIYKEVNGLTYKLHTEINRLTPEDREQYCNELKQAKTYFDELQLCLNDIDTHTDLWVDYKSDYNNKDILIYDIEFRMIVNQKFFCNTWMKDRYPQWKTICKDGRLYVATYIEHLKCDKNNIFPEYTDDLLLETAKELSKEPVSFKIGKRNSESGEPYKALVVGEGFNQLGHITAYKGAHNIITLSYSVPLCGSSWVTTSPKTLKQDVKEILQFMGAV